MPRGIGDLRQTDPANFVTRLQLHRQQHQRLPAGPATTFARLLAAQIALIGFHHTVQTITPRTHHRPTQLVNIAKENWQMERYI